MVMSGYGGVGVIVLALVYVRIDPYSGSGRELFASFWGVCLKVGFFFFWSSIQVDVYTSQSSRVMTPIQIYRSVANQFVELTRAHPLPIGSFSNGRFVQSFWACPPIVGSSSHCRLVHSLQTRPFIIGSSTLGRLVHLL